MGLKIKFKKGLIDIPGTPFSEGLISFEMENRKINARTLKWQDNCAKYENLNFEVFDGAKLQFKVKTNSEKINHISIEFPVKDLLVDDYLEYIHSQFFTHPCSVKRVGSKSRFEDINRESSMLYLLHKRESKDSFLFAVDGEHKGDYLYFSAIHSERNCDGAFGLKIRWEFCCNGDVESTAISVYRSNDPIGLLENLGDRLSNNCKLCAKGWNSWDYFTGSIAATDMLNNAIISTKLSSDLRYCVIDAGYYPRWGEWIAGEKFPEGFEAYCQEIRSAGMEPGIWSAPLCMNVYSRFYMEHPECFGRKSNGDIATKTLGYGASAFMDITHPMVQKYLSDSFTHLKRSGFTYFKVDFSYELQENCQLFYDSKIPRGMLVRKLFEIIRNAVGSDSYILACGAPYEAVRGVVDAVRSCNDIHNYWSHVLFCTASISARFWMNRKLWNLDPDFLIVRAKGNCSHKLLNKPSASIPFAVDFAHYWQSGREANIMEMKVWLLLAMVTCGDMFLSDDLTALNEEARAFLKKVIEHKQTAPAIPIDLFDRHDTLPSIWAAKDFIAFFNFTEDPKTLHFKLSPMIKDVNNFWGDFKGEVINGELVVILPSRRSEGFFL